ncbi:hypothetical protein [Kitasatospora sp. NPDC050543]|uniref:hypothetical protein n=1 Tax=Kitasatospora sp. NPDC050543 TaxID=3364054 RepID=UPI00379DA0CF
MSGVSEGYQHPDQYPHLRPGPNPGPLPGAQSYPQPGSQSYPNGVPGWPAPEQAPYAAQAGRPAPAGYPQDDQLHAPHEPYAPAGQQQAPHPYAAQPPYPQPQQQPYAPAQQQQPYGQAGTVQAGAAQPYAQAFPAAYPEPETQQLPVYPKHDPAPYPPQSVAAPQPPAPAAPAPAPAAPGVVRTGSPIIEPGLQPALITAALAALLAGGAALGLGRVPLALVVALLQALTAAGWFRLNGMWPARQGIALAALAGFTADAAMLLTDVNGGAAAAVGTLGGFFLLVLVLQTFRPSDPAERFYALTVLGSATVVTVFCSALLLADWVPAAVGAVAAATVLSTLPLPGPKVLAPLLGVAAAAGLGLLVGAPAALGALAGVGALVGRRVAAYDFPSRFVHMTAGVALPLAVAAPLVWLGSRLLAG